ncbi:ABC transporter substrate-binding protein [Streptomyces sp. WAC 06738]|uniref:ABC transporter substrate-binding protein n=1 Tax=Streptomyces sp. WAC 06738 TaxID=2203210 RepID=UPI000F70A90C|nr:ABC transporter substrate-binding protein [Streptomyces sp. WAC 06738]AZM46664.1 ABC transporter substrate-binding protein [Streptomyces sp. WAC 06738]
MRDFGTFVGEARGPVHTGPGDQYVYIAAMAEASQRLGNRGKDPRAVAKEQLAFVHRRFVPPRHLGEARRLLCEHRTAVLCGPSGSGRHTAAQMLLYETAAGTGIHEVDPEDGEDGRAKLDRRAVGDGDRLLLDLSGCGAARFTGLQGELSDFRSVLEERDARLVVVLSPHLRDSLPAELHRLMVHVDRPPADQVLMRYLRREQLTPPLAALAVPDLDGFLADAPMRDVARLAEGIRRARDAAPEGSFGEWWPGPLAQLREDDPGGAQWVDQLTDGRQRALALTVAMLQGATPETVHAAVTALLDEAGHPEDERPRLDRTDLHTELSKLGCPTGPDGRVRYARPRRARTVLTHFWSYFPGLRPEFHAWVARCVRDLRLDREERDRFIEHFAEQALRTGHPEELRSLARKWTDRGGHRLMPDAAKVLAAGVNHDVHGRTVRQQILDDARQRGDQSRAYRLALTVVCAQVMAVNHPDQALVRLHHLAREEDGDRRPALDSLLSLATSDRRLYALLLSRLTTSGLGPTGFRWPGDTRVFLALAEAVAGRPDLCTGPAATARLTECLAAVFAHRPHEEWAPHVPAWLTAAQAARAPAHRDALLATLAAAAAPYPAAAGRTYVLSQQWVRACGSDRAQRRDVAERYRRRLDTAQGLGRTHPEPGHPDSDTPPEAPR